MAEQKRDRGLWLPIVTVVLAFLLFLVLMLQAWNLQVWPSGSGIDYQRAGNWAEMLAGIGTTGAVTLGLIGFWVERRRSESEAQRAAEDIMTALYAWLAPKERNASEEGPAWYLKFENRSGVPVYRWKVLLLGTPEHVCSIRMGPIRPGESEMSVPALQGVEHAEVPRVELAFAAGGRHWLRNQDGIVRPANEPNFQCSHVETEPE